MVQFEPRRIVVVVGALLSLPVGRSQNIFRPGSSNPFQAIEIRSAADPSLCWDIPNGSHQPGTPIQWYPCHGGPAQVFEAYHRSTGGLRAIPDMVNLYHQSSGLCVTQGSNQLEIDTCIGSETFGLQGFLLRDIVQTVLNTQAESQLASYDEPWNCVTADSTSQHSNFGIAPCVPSDSLQQIQFDLCRTFHPHVFYSDFCSPWCPCDVFEGNCDDSSECQSGLICKHTSGTDFCCPPFTGYQSGFCSKECPCGNNQGECSIDEECVAGLECQFDASSGQSRCQVSAVGSGCPEGQICCGFPINGECLNYCVENPSECP